jgi:hypothetical protein
VERAKGILQREFKLSEEEEGCNRKRGPLLSSGVYATPIVLDNAPDI